MKKILHLLSFLLVAASSIFMAGCGGSSGTPSTIVNDDRPVFSMRNFSRSSDFAPSGNITETSPIFIWPAINNASTYQLGLEDPNDASIWDTYDATAAEAQCNNVANNICTFKPGHEYSIGDHRLWWVRAKVNGVWADWTSSHGFTVVDDIVAVGIPETIAPTGIVNSRNPAFTWKAVQDATEYRLGYDEQNTINSWEEITLSATDLNCTSVNQICTFATPQNLFKNGDDIEWWVRARIAGNLGEWSTVKDFTVDVATPTAGLIINEVLAANTLTNLDPDFIEFSDWIELYNPSNQDINISNYGLSDDNQPLQWKFPAGTIVKANDFLLVWADGKDINNKALHTNFKLSSKGETVTLADSSGTVIDSIDFNKQNSDISIANQNGSIVFMQPTPGGQNTLQHASKDRSETPQYSHESGFYSNSLSVVLTQSNNAEIYFTTDGSIPDENSQKYAQAINVTQTSVIRAVALESGGLLSKIVSQTYFINHVTTLPVVSLVVDPTHLYDPKTGIYTDGDGTNGAPLLNCTPYNTGPKNYVQDWERPADIEYFAANQVSEFTLTAGLSISGECSRENEKKSFSVELDSKYGSKSLNYKLYADKDLNKVKDFKFRTGAYGYQIADILAAAMTKDGNLNLDYQAYTATQMFVNGHYWGLYNIREKKGKDFITSNYPNIDKDNLDIINEGVFVKAGDIIDYEAFIALLYSKNYDLSDNADYQEVLSKFDEESFIDYMALMIYTANNDWINSNFRAWKEKVPAGKWRWIVDDIDGGFDNDFVNLNQFNEIMNADSTALMIELFRSIVKNTTFKQKFKTRFVELLDTTFSTANMATLITNIVDERKNYISLETPVWSDISQDVFDYYVQTVEDFASARNAIVRAQLDIFIP